jgi:hypothetical protein
MSVTRLRRTKRHVSVATVMHAAIEELWEAVFSVDPYRGYIWRTETESVRVDWSDEWLQSGLARRPAAEQCSLETAVSECSS